MCNSYILFLNYFEFLCEFEQRSLVVIWNEVIRIIIKYIFSSDSLPALKFCYLAFTTRISGGFSFTFRKYYFINHHHAGEAEWHSTRIFECSRQSQNIRELSIDQRPLLPLYHRNKNKITWFSTSKCQIVTTQWPLKQS